MDDIVERIENNFINIYNKFDILDKKLNDYHMKFYKINEMIDIIISDVYTINFIKHITQLKIMIYHKTDFLYTTKSLMFH